LEAISVIYFDERGVSRNYQSTFSGNVLSLWRDAPDFAQRFTGTLDENSNTLQVVWELAEDGKNWAKDLELTYTRVK
jgi:hypothetical protein